jgi:hypothetical protein
VLPPPSSVRPVGYSPKVIAKGRAVWELINARPLTDREINKIIYNVDGLLRVLFNLKGAVERRNSHSFPKGEIDESLRSKA